MRRIETHSESKQATRAFLQRIARQYDVADAYLFGSRARNAHQPESDTDIAVVLRGTGGDFLATKLAMTDIAYDILLETGVRIQVLPVWEDEWANPADYSNPDLLQNITRDGIHL